MNSRNVYVFLFDGFSDWEIAYLTPELHKSEQFKLHYFSKDGNPVVSMGGLQVTPHLSVEQVDVNEIELLILPGGSAWETQSISGIEQLVEDVYQQQKSIAAICAATTFLGQKGFLDNRQHTSNALPYLQQVAPNYQGTAYYQNEFAVTDQHIITANGTAPVEFTREIFKTLQLYSPENIEKWFQLYLRHTI